MRFTNIRLTGLQADKTLSGSTRLCRDQLKNIVKLLLYKFDLGDCGGLCSKGNQRGTSKKEKLFGGLGGLVGQGGWG